MRRMRVLAWVGGVVAVLLLAVVVVGQLITAGVDEYYSPGFHSESPAHARARGVLLAPVEVGDSVLRWRGREYRVREAWVEDQQQIYYRALFFRRDSLLHRPTLVVRIEGATPRPPDGDALCVALGESKLVVNGATSLDGNDCRQWYGSVGRPFPSRITLSVREPAPAATAAPSGRSNGSAPLLNEALKRSGYARTPRRASRPRPASALAYRHNPAAAPGRQAAHLRSGGPRRLPHPRHQ